METERCKNDYPKLNHSINNSYMEDQKGNMGTLKQASVGGITQNTPLNNPLALDLNKVNRIKQKQQELLEAAK